MSFEAHPVAPDEVMALLDGELSADRSPSVSAHINDCAECGGAAHLFQNTSVSLANWTVPNVSAVVEHSVLERASGVRNVSRDEFILDRRRILSRRTVFASGVGLVILLAFLGLSSTQYHMVGSRISAHRDMAVDNAAPAASPTVQDKAVRPLFVPEKGKNQILEPWQGPMVARTVSLSIVVKDFEIGRTSLDAILTRHNGYAASLNVTTPQGAARTLEASLRIPAPQLAPALSELKSLGRVERETQNGEEVTEQHADLVARIKNERETELSLQDILRRPTGRVRDVLEVEQEIARVRGEIEQMEAEQKSLEHRVEFSTIDLKLAEEYKAQLNTPAPSVLMQLRNATINGLRNASESFLALLLFVAEGGPILLLWLALLGLPAWRLWRRYRRAQSLAPLAGA